MSGYGVHKYLNDFDYGKPVHGSRTEFRGKRADVHISSEIVELCNVIKEIGTFVDDGSFVVQFGHLFETYTRISNKIVGVLIRARKHGLIEFDGEILYQGRDNNKIIRLIRSPDLLQQSINQRQLELEVHPGNLAKYSHSSFK